MKILKHEKFLELWLSQKRLAPCACACGKSPKHFIEDMNFETRQRCGTCPPSKQNKTKFTCQQWGALVCIDHFRVFCKDYTPGDFHPDRSVGHVVPRWKSPDVMVDCEFGWNHTTLWL